eukprot:1176089-Prorocentrum_minimum.AAC.3
MVCPIGVYTTRRGRSQVSVFGKAEGGTLAQSARLHPCGSHTLPHTAAPVRTLAHLGTFTRARVRRITAQFCCPHRLSILKGI